MNAPTKIPAKRLAGYDRLHNARLNKGTAFPEAERSAFGLEGLLPPVGYSNKSGGVFNCCATTWARQRT
jgi:hypothetical protein